MKTLLYAFAGLLMCSTCKAQESGEYTLMHYNIHSIATNISDKDCQDLLSVPLYYSVSDNHMDYKDVSPDYNIADYHPLNQSFIGKRQYLYLGVYDVRFELQGKQYSHQEQISYVLNRDDQRFKGNFILPGLCKGELAGWIVQH
jgi:hypothetical protein